MLSSKNKEMNEFELELVAGGGNASFPASRLKTPEQQKAFMKVTGTSQSTLNSCLSNGCVDVAMVANTQEFVGAPIVK